MPVMWPCGISSARSIVIEPGPQPTSRIFMEGVRWGRR